MYIRFRSLESFYYVAIVFGLYFLLFGIVELIRSYYPKPQVPENEKHIAYGSPISLFFLCFPLVILILFVYHHGLNYGPQLMQKLVVAVCLVVIGFCLKNVCNYIFKKPYLRLTPQALIIKQKRSIAWHNIKSVSIESGNICIILDDGEVIVIDRREIDPPVMLAVYEIKEYQKKIVEIKP